MQLDRSKGTETYRMSLDRSENLLDRCKGHTASDTAHETCKDTKTPVTNRALYVAVYLINENNVNKLPTIEQQYTTYSARQHLLLHTHTLSQQTHWVSCLSEAGAQKYVLQATVCGPLRYPCNASRRWPTHVTLEATSGTY